MSKPHKDLPAGSQPWAAEVDQAMAKIKELEAVIRRLTENAGMDFSNPRRGMSSDSTPSTNNPVGQKLSSLADVDSYNVLEGQVLGWSGQGQKWLPVNQTGGAQWKLATEEEHLRGELDSDSDYDSTQVMGLYDHDTTGSTQDSYGLVGTSTTSAFLHGAARWYGGTTKAHGYVSAEPFYCKMGVAWLDDAGGVGGMGAWDAWGEINIDRESIYFTTPLGKPSTLASQEGRAQRDGAIVFRTNWLYLPRVNGYMEYWGYPLEKRPVPETGQTPLSGAVVYDVTLKKPIYWEGTKWVDAMGNDIPAPLY